MPPPPTHTRPPLGMCPPPLPPPRRALHWVAAFGGRLHARLEPRAVPISQAGDQATKPGPGTVRVKTGKYQEGG
jgi:hypothetical protein